MSTGQACVGAEDLGAECRDWQKNSAARVNDAVRRQICRRRETPHRDRDATLYGRE